MKSFEERFWVKVKKSSQEQCWDWLGSKDYKGYGKLRNGQVFVQAHRMTYELCVGPIPEGLTIDHLCRNRACVNPNHLEPVSNQDEHIVQMVILMMLTILVLLLVDGVLVKRAIVNPFVLGVKSRLPKKLSTH